MLATKLFSSPSLSRLSRVSLVKPQPLSHCSSSSSFTVHCWLPIIISSLLIHGHSFTAHKAYVPQLTAVCSASFQPPLGHASSRCHSKSLSQLLPPCTTANSLLPSVSFSVSHRCFVSQPANSLLHLLILLPAAFSRPSSLRSLRSLLIVCRLFPLSTYDHSHTLGFSVFTVAAAELAIVGLPMQPHSAAASSSQPLCFSSGNFSGAAAQPLPPVCFSHHANSLPTSHISLAATLSHGPLSLSASLPSAISSSAAQPSSRQHSSTLRPVAVSPSSSRWPAVSLQLHLLCLLAELLQPASQPRPDQLLAQLSSVSVSAHASLSAATYVSAISLG